MSESQPKLVYTSVQASEPACGSAQGLSGAAGVHALGGSSSDKAGVSSDKKGSQENLGAQMLMRQKEQEVVDFLHELSLNPPELPYEPTLIPLLYSVTKAGSPSSIADVTRVIERSPKLAAKILQVANAAAYRQMEPVTSLHRAVSVLGFKEVRSIVVLVGAVGAIDKGKVPVAFDGLALLQHQILTGSIARIFAVAMQDISSANRPVVDPEEAYTAGLLHDLGEVLLAMYRPYVWAQVAHEAMQGVDGLYSAETGYWPLSHATIGSFLARLWGLPELLCDMIEWHHTPASAVTHRREVALLAAANILALEGLEPGSPLPLKVAKLLPPDANLEVIASIVSDYMQSGQFKELAHVVY